MGRGLTIMKCVRHDLWAISIDGERSGKRLTPNKCCGTWTTIKRFEMSPDELRVAAEEILREACELQRENEEG